MAKKTAKKKDALACPHCGYIIKLDLLHGHYERRGRQRRFRILCPNTECARVVEVRVKVTPTFSLCKAQGSA